MSEKYIVYAHVNKINNKKYIGITCRSTKERWGTTGERYQGCTAFYLAIKKYGWENFEHIILEHNLNKEQAEEKEIYYIQYYNTTDKKYGYNISLGGKAPLAGRHHTEEAKRKISEANKGKVFSQEHRKKLSESHVGKISPNKGKIFSQEHCKKLSESHMGEKNPRSKAVMCIETKIIYASCSEAAYCLGKDRVAGGSHISKSARNERKTAYGFHWKYVIDLEEI